MASSSTLARGRAPAWARAPLRVRAVATTAKPGSSSTAAAKGKASLTPEVAKELYYDMVLGREFEEMCAQMYYRGKMFGFVHLYSGQEAVSSGARRDVMSHHGLSLIPI